MGIELEYKYLLEKLPDFSKYSYDKINILQNYCMLNDDQKKKLYELFDIHSEMHVFRVRKIVTLNSKYDEIGTIKYVLTLKSKGELSREEYECEIDEKMFSELSINIESTVLKNRYTVKIENFVFEFDEYLNLSIDLKTVEVELNSEKLNEEEIKIAKENIENILKNHFLLKIEDVTADLKYKNSNLYKYFKK